MGLRPCGLVSSACSALDGPRNNSDQDQRPGNTQPRLLPIASAYWHTTSTAQQYLRTRVYVQHHTRTFRFTSWPTYGAKTNSTAYINGGNPSTSPSTFTQLPPLFTLSLPRRLPCPDIATFLPHYVAQKLCRFRWPSPSSPLPTGNGLTTTTPIENRTERGNSLRCYLLAVRALKTLIGFAPLAMTLSCLRYDGMQRVHERAQVREPGRPVRELARFAYGAEYMPPMDYLGVSKLSCNACAMFIQASNKHSNTKFYARGSHGKWNSLGLSHRLTIRFRALSEIT